MLPRLTRFLLLARWPAIALSLTVFACGGGSPSRPTPAPPTPPAPPPPPWTVSGKVTATHTQQPVAGARVESFIANATTDIAGLFTLTASPAPPGSLGITVSANGHRPRETVIGMPRLSDLVVDLVSTAPPFDEKFYNQMARDALDDPEEVYPLYRLNAAPSFYVRTLDETLRVVGDRDLQIVRQGIRDGVHYYSGGRFQAVIEEGTATRPELSGWVNVFILQEIPEGDYCGLASTVGGDAMWIKLRLDRCGCGSTKIPPDVVVHEVGHAMGLFHVAGRNDVMSTAFSNNCRPVIPTAKEQFHAALIYARPRGNRDPDRDPGGFALSDLARPPARR